MRKCCAWFVCFGCCRRQGRYRRGPLHLRGLDLDYKVVAIVEVAIEVGAERCMGADVMDGMIHGGWLLRRIPFVWLDSGLDLVRYRQRSARDG